MPTYAILGSTGNCGTALIHNLLKSSDNKINAYCRNVAKLHKLVPEVIDNKQVQVFTGSITDVELMEACVRDTQAVFMVATTNDNIPGCRISQVRGCFKSRSHFEIWFNILTAPLRIVLPPSSPHWRTSRPKRRPASSSPRSSFSARPPSIPI